MYPVVRSNSVIVQIVGWLPDDVAAGVVDNLRVLKTKSILPIDMELGFVPKSKYAGQFPGLYIFSATGGRFARPVCNLRSGGVEWIGTLEQLYLNICVLVDEAVSSEMTHAELTEQVFLSEVAAMTPYSDHNQSPRNLYQCQV